jgi:hypothetical protein
MRTRGVIAPRGRISVIQAEAVARLAAAADSAPRAP